jgi:hypothetical protein
LVFEVFWKLNKDDFENQTKKYKEFQGNIKTDFGKIMNYFFQTDFMEDLNEIESPKLISKKVEGRKGLKDEPRLSQSIIIENLKQIENGDLEKEEENEKVEEDLSNSSSSKLRITDEDEKFEEKKRWKDKLENMRKQKIIKTSRYESMRV